MKNKFIEINRPWSLSFSLLERATIASFAILIHLLLFQVDGRRASEANRVNWIYLFLQKLAKPRSLTTLPVRDMKKLC